MKACLLLADNRLDDLMALLSEHIEGIDTARKGPSAKIKWLGASQKL